MEDITKHLQQLFLETKKKKKRLVSHLLLLLQVISILGQVPETHGHQANCVYSSMHSFSGDVEHS